MPQQVWYLLRREPYYHKLQYSKTPKFDASAALLGVTLGAFGSYAALGSLGSGGADLTDLTALVWYIGLLWLSARQRLACLRLAPPASRLIWVALSQEILAAAALHARSAWADAPAAGRDQR